MGAMSLLINQGLISEPFSLLTGNGCCSISTSSEEDNVFCPRITPSQPTRPLIWWLRSNDDMMDRDRLPEK